MDKQPANNINEMVMRPLFERAMILKVSSLKRDANNGEYEAPDAHRAWLSWQACAEMLLQSDSQSKILHGFEREDLEAIASTLESRYQKGVDVGGSPVDWTNVNMIESPTAAAARFIRAALALSAPTPAPGAAVGDKAAARRIMFDAFARCAFPTQEMTPDEIADVLLGAARAVPVDPSPASDEVDCGGCDGTGRHNPDPDDVAQEDVCEHCGGSGKAAGAPVAALQGVEPAGWRDFIKNIATPYSEPLNSVVTYRDMASRKQMMGELRSQAQALLADAAAEPGAQPDIAGGQVTAATRHAEPEDELAPIPWQSVVQAIRAVDAEAARRGEMFPQHADEQREDRAAARRVVEKIEWYAQHGGAVAEKLDAWPRADVRASHAPQLAVSFGPMPESNGKSNFTARLIRKGSSRLSGFEDGITIACSEYPDQVRYKADCLRYLIGELAQKPSILDYDGDKHSGYVPPAKETDGPVTTAASNTIAAAEMEEPEDTGDTGCWCHSCNRDRKIFGIPYSSTRMILCPNCGNKRCPHANDHRNACTGSNNLGQPGSAYP